MNDDDEECDAIREDDDVINDDCGNAVPLLQDRQQIKAPNRISRNRLMTGLVLFQEASSNTTIRCLQSKSRTQLTNVEDVVTVVMGSARG